MIARFAGFVKSNGIFKWAKTDFVKNGALSKAFRKRTMMCSAGGSGNFAGEESLRHGFAVPPPFHKGGVVKSPTNGMQKFVILSRRRRISFCASFF